jgi:RNA polymerase sigma factor (sigma-70 family)
MRWRKLCEAYWYPLYAYVRRRGHSSQDACDLTQEFFARFLAKNYLHSVAQEKGRFRSFLLACLNHFLADECDRAKRQKRGGGETCFSLDEEIAEGRYRFEPVEIKDPVKIFERRWALTMVEQSLGRLEKEFVKSGKSAVFAEIGVFLLTDGAGATYAQIATNLNTTEGSVKVMVHRLRKRFGEMFREEVLHTVTNKEDLNEELRYLAAVLS